jgi:hypothetical protein
MERREREFDVRMRVGGIVLVATLLSCAGLAAVLWYRAPLPRSYAEPTGNLSPTTKVPAAAEEHPASTGQRPDSNLQEAVKAPQPVQVPPEPSAVNDSRVDAIVTSEDQSKTIIPASRDVPADLTKEPAGAGHLHLLSDNVNRNRIDFEITHNRTDEVAPGIYLTVRNTNVEQQRIDVWLQIAEDGRTVRIREQKAQTVVLFTTKRDARSRELVFTRIDKSGAAGYLLIPTETNG